MGRAFCPRLQLPGQVVEGEEAKAQRVCWLLIRWDVSNRSKRARLPGGRSGQHDAVQSDAWCWQPMAHRGRL